MFLRLRLVILCDCLMFYVSSTSRAVTLVRKTKGENRRGRSHPLRCDRQRWYGGTRGRGHRGVSGEAAPHAVITPGHHTQHTPPNPPLLQHFSFFLFLSFLTSSLTPLVYFLLWWTDLCMPLLDSIHQSYQCCGLNLFYLLNCMTWVQRDGAAKDDKMKPRSKQTTESLPAASFHEHNFQVWCDSEFFRSWLTKWITSHKTFARNVLPAKPFISHGATGLGCDPLVARITRLFLSGSTCRDESECDWIYHRINTYIQCICRTKKKMNATPVLLNLNQKLLYLFLKEDFSFFLSSYLNMT